MKVGETVNKNKLIKDHNISRYNYCIIRKCFRTEFELLKNTPDMKDSKTKQKSDDNCL